MRVKPRSYAAIFRDYAAGQSPRAIARKLNKKGIPGPSGGPWRDTAIRGHFTRGTGILNNELYIGRLVWNRLTYLKDPKSGRRRSRLNPPDNGLSRRSLRSASSMTTLWEAVKTRQGSIRDKRPRGQCACHTLLGAPALSSPAQRAVVLPRMWQSLCLDRPRLPRLLCRPRQRHLFQSSEHPSGCSGGIDHQWAAPTLDGARAR